MAAASPDASLVVRGLTELPRVSAWLHAWARQHGVPADTADRLDLCSAELVTNIVTHGWGAADAGRQIVLTLRRHSDTVSLDIEDDGVPFDPLAAAVPRLPVSLDDAPVGGWGIPIVRRFSDGLRYRRADGRNRLTVLHRCRSHAPP